MDALIFADDLSGGNATAALCARLGRPVLSVFDVALLGGPLTPVTVVDIETRSAGPAAVERAVARVLRRIGSRPPLVGLRLDSTLRGNWGIEIAALLPGPLAPDLVVVVPAYPAAGRRCERGIVTVDGRPLAEATAGLPGAPTTSSALAILLEQTAIAAVPIMLGEVRAGPAALAERLATLQRAGSRVAIVDAVADSDLDSIAAAIQELPLRVLPVDPGPVLSRLAPAGEAPGPSPAAGAPVLVFLGTSSDLAARELAELQAARPLTLVELDPAALGGRSDPVPRAALQQVVTALAATDLVVVRPRPGPLQPSRQIALDRAFAALARRVQVSAARPPRGLVMTGGATALAVAQGLGARGLLVEREVRPLVARASLLGGTSSGLPVVTKGGLVPGLAAAVGDLLDA